MIVKQIRRKRPFLGPQRAQNRGLKHLLCLMLYVSVVVRTQRVASTRATWAMLINCLQNLYFKPEI